MPPCRVYYHPRHFTNALNLLGSILASLVHGSSCAMALPDSWLRMERAIYLQQATGAAKDVLNKGGDLRFKQKQVQYLLSDVDISGQPFECIFSELEDQMNDAELESYHEVFRVEVTTAGRDAQKEIARLGEANGFQTADLKVITGYVASKLAVTKQRRKISEAPSCIEEAISITHLEELSLLENMAKANLQKVIEAQKDRQLEAHTDLWSSPQNVRTELNARLAEIHTLQSRMSTPAANANQRDRIVDDDSVETCSESTGDALQYAHSDISAFTPRSPSSQNISTVAPLTSEHYCDYPYKVFSDDDASLPTEIPDGPRCRCPLGCIKLLQYCSTSEIARGKCWGCQPCKGAASAGECFCECLGCEQGYRLHLANTKNS